MISKKLTILKIEIIKILFREGKFVKFRDQRFKNLKWLVDKATSSEYILGMYEKELLETLQRLLSHGNVFYDLGAHWGYFSLFASNLVGNTGHIYSFEPDSSNYKKLLSNISENQLKNITTFNNAVSNCSKELVFSNTGNSYGNSYINSPTTKENSVRIKSVSLDELIKNNSAKPPNFIKIDVEGAELDVLEGSIEIIKFYRPIIHLSTHNIHKNGVDRLCLAFLNQQNYKEELISSHVGGGIKDYIFYPN